MWKTAFKKLEVIWSAEANHITSNFLEAAYHEFYFSILEYLDPNIDCIKPSVAFTKYDKILKIYNLEQHITIPNNQSLNHGLPESKTVT